MAGKAANPAAHRFRHAGMPEGGADHKNRYDDNGGFAAKTGKSLFGRQQLGHRQRQDNQHRYQIVADTFSDQQRESHHENNQEEGLLQIKINQHGVHSPFS